MRKISCFGHIYREATRGRMRREDKGELGIGNFVQWQDENDVSTIGRISYFRKGPDGSPYAILFPMHYQEAGKWRSVPFEEREENAKMPVEALTKIRYRDWADTLQRADDQLRAEI